jgi:hypothetical protein
MKKSIKSVFYWKSVFILLAIILIPGYIFSADIAGTWKAEFETQIGMQKYTFTFTQNEIEITGTAASDIGGEKHEVKLTDIKLDSSAISFVEIMQFQEMELRISYKGVISGNEMKLTRNVGDFVTEELMAKREETKANP